LKYFWLLTVVFLLLLAVFYKSPAIYSSSENNKISYRDDCNVHELPSFLTISKKAHSDKAGIGTHNQRSAGLFEC